MSIFLRIKTRNVSVLLNKEKINDKFLWLSLLTINLIVFIMCYRTQERLPWMSGRAAGSA